MQIAQPALAVLDVGLDLVAGFTRALVALVALAELGRDEIARAAGHDFYQLAALEVSVDGRWAAIAARAATAASMTATAGALP